MASDTGMTNNRPSLSLASIGASNARQISNAVRNVDPYELAAKVMVYPIGKLPEIVALNDDAYFLGCVATGWAAGLIPFQPPTAQ